MHREFDACLIKEHGTRRIFFRGLLLSDDPRTTLFLFQVQQVLENLLGPVQLEVIRYPSGTEARGQWLAARNPQRAVVFYDHDPQGWTYSVQDQGNLVACTCVTPGVDLRSRIIYTLLDGVDDEPYPTRPFERGAWPEGFPDSSRHPG